MNNASRPSHDETVAPEKLEGLAGALAALLERIWLIVLLPIALGLLALALSYAVPPTYTAKVVLLPPQQQQSAAAMALQSLGALGGLAGSVVGVKSNAEQFAGLLQSAAVRDRLIDAFDLMNVYRAEFTEDARLGLARRTRVGIGKRDGFITVEVDDGDPVRAAGLANAYAAELERVADRLAIGEAKQRRVFFERNLLETRERFAQAQRALQAAGINEGAIRSEPKAAAETYSRLRAEMLAAELKVRAMRTFLAESAVELQQAQAQLAALRARVDRAESENAGAAQGDYANRFREFKHQEALLELFTRQYEAARLDESREGLSVQVLDPATPPERRSSPKRTLIAVVTTLFSAIVVIGFVLTRRALGGRDAGEAWAAIRAAAARGVGRRPPPA